ncbi:MAG: lysylphosphatidylglycerol synthase transmembrane domain-containing protein [Chloroflexota bacterium]|nr:lysylphosphatidylglycerol synthase transmembrane domain-containing protein [Chloroflexota bacterium]
MSLGRLGKPLRLAVGIAISLFLVWLLLRDVHLGDVARTLQKADLRFLVPIALVFFTRYWLRAIRWRILVEHLKSVTTRRALPRVILGQAANMALPFGLGYVLMIQVTARKFGIGRLELLGAEALERIMDGFVFALLMAVAIATLTIGDSFTGLGAFMLFGTPAGIALAWFLTRERGEPPSAIGWRGLLAHPRIEPFLRGLRSVQSARQTSNVLVLTAAIWMSEALLYWAVAASLGISLNFLVHVFVVAAANIGAGIPLAQASVGLAFLAKEALVALGETQAAALSYAVGVEAIIILPAILLAPLAAWDMRLGWRDAIPRFGRDGPRQPAVSMNRVRRALQGQ